MGFCPELIGKTANFEVDSHSLVATTTRNFPALCIQHSWSRSLKVIIQEWITPRIKFDSNDEKYDITKADKSPQLNKNQRLWHSPWGWGHLILWSCPPSDASLWSICWFRRSSLAVWTPPNQLQRKEETQIQGPYRNALRTHNFSTEISSSCPM